MNKRAIRVTVASLAAVAMLSLGGCFGKFSEPFKDAKVEDRNTDPAEVGTMPDGFSNFATKCDRGNRVYVLYHGDQKYGSIAVVPHAADCER